MNAARSGRSDELTIKVAALSGSVLSDLVSYINGDLARIRAQALDVARGGHGDPEAEFIRSIDALSRHRIVRRALGSIGPVHARTLICTYSRTRRRSPYLDATFGDFGPLAMSVAADSAALLGACRSVALSVATLEQRRAVQAILTRCQALHSSACAAYLPALELARRTRFRGGPVWTPPHTAPHRCRISVEYPCPCAVPHG